MISVGRQRVTPVARMRSSASRTRSARQRRRVEIDAAEAVHLQVEEARQLDPHAGRFPRIGAARSTGGRAAPPTRDRDRASCAGASAGSTPAPSARSAPSTRRLAPPPPCARRARCRGSRAPRGSGGPTSRSPAPGTSSTDANQPSPTCWRRHASSSVTTRYGSLGLEVGRRIVEREVAVLADADERDVDRRGRQLPPDARRRRRAASRLAVEQVITRDARSCGSAARAGSCGSWPDGRSAGPTYSSRWNSSTRGQSMPGAARERVEKVELRLRRSRRRCARAGWRSMPLAQRRRRMPRRGPAHRPAIAEGFNPHHIPTSSAPASGGS